MNILGWAMIGLVAGVLIQSLVPWKGTETSARNRAALLAVIISVNVMSALDAVSTIYLVAHNHSREMNPFMGALIERSYLLFFLIKSSLTMIATLVCWHYFARKRKARMILRLTSRIYCGLLAWHCMLLSSVLL